MRKAWLCLIGLALMSNAAAAQGGKGIRFWNLTSATIEKLYLSPAGKDAWGPNQCANDKDGTVDHDERLRITGVEPGRYDVRLAQKGGRVCLVKNIEIKANGVFSIEDKHLTDCQK